MKLNFKCIYIPRYEFIWENLFSIKGFNLFLLIECSVFLKPNREFRLNLRLVLFIFCCLYNVYILNDIKIK
jgi:hypothetical protein